METMAVTAIIRPRTAALIVREMDAFAAMGFAVMRIPVAIDFSFTRVALVADTLAFDIAFMTANIPFLTNIPLLTVSFPFMPANIAMLATVNILAAGIVALMMRASAVAMCALLRVAARTLLRVPASSAISLRTRMSAAMSATAALRSGMAAALVILVRV